MLLDLHTDFSGGRLGGLVFPSLEEFPTVCCDPHKDFGVVNKAEVDVFLELSCFFHDPSCFFHDVVNLISDSSAFYKSSLNIWKFTVHVLLKPGLENFEHHFASMGDECNCAVVLHDPDNHDGVITHLEPDILEYEVKWALGSIATNKASGGDGIPVELFQILKVDAVKVLHSICQQIWKTQQWPQDWKRSVFIPIPKKGNAKECSNYHKKDLVGKKND